MYGKLWLHIYPIAANIIIEIGDGYLIYVKNTSIITMDEVGLHLLVMLQSEYQLNNCSNNFKTL